MLIKIPDTSGLVTKNVVNTKISEVQNKIPGTSDLVNTTVLNTKISESKNKVTDNSKYMTTHKFGKLTAETFAAALNPADSVIKQANFDDNFTSFNRRITSNKTKHYFKRN